MQRIVISGWTMALVLALSGCGGEKDIPLNVTAGETAGDAGAEGSGGIDHVLVGTWKGGIQMDDAAALAAYTEDQIAMYRSMTIEIEFASTGEMAMAAVTQTPQGPEESTSIGTWEVVKEENNRFTIRSTEEQSGATEEIELVMADENTILLAAGDDISVFRLQRQ